MTQDFLIIFGWWTGLAWGCGSVCKCDVVGTLTSCGCINPGGGLNCLDVSICGILGGPRRPKLLSYSYLIQCFVLNQIISHVVDVFNLGGGREWTGLKFGGLCMD